MYITLSPSEIRYTQDSIASCFQNGNDIEDLILDIINGQTTPDKIRTIRVFFKDGKYYSEDNRRLYVLKTVQELSEPYLMITVKLTSYFDFEENKFTTTNDGLRIRVRRNRNDAKKPRNVKRPLSESNSINKVPTYEDFPSLTSGGPTKTTYASPRTTPVKAAKTKITYEDFPSLTSGGPTKTTYASPRTTPVKAAKTKITYEDFPSLTSGGPTKTTYASPRTTPVKAAKTKITYEDFPSLTSGGPTKTTYASPRTTPVEAAKTKITYEDFPSLTSGGPTKTTYASPRTTPVKAAKTKITYEDFPSLTSGGPTKTTYASPRTTPVKAAKTECKRSAGTTDKTLICHSDILPSSWSLTTDDASSATNVPPSICITPRPSAMNVPPSICITPRPSATNVPPSICITPRPSATNVPPSICITPRPSAHIKSKPSRLEKLSCCVIL
ncbi:Hypothetical predicted protein [Octopus vulgaris]|uniref:Uncharacterized protein n=1 Tax=Octopus vulgaris TaxID=6645 RepID=A0AA36F2U7_OCTVU|nr:Hypothetical predicted protein [Octopus vulgaris]